MRPSLLLVLACVLSPTALLPQKPNPQASQGPSQRPSPKPSPKIEKADSRSSGTFHDFKVAMGLLTKAKLGPAKRMLEKITKQAPTYPEAWHLLASCYELERKTREAKRYAKKTLALDPKHARAALMMGRLLLAKDPELAADWARQAAKYAQNNGIVRRKAARILLETGNVEEAEKILATLAAKDPKGQRLLMLRAELALRQHKLDKAIKLFRLLAILRPSDIFPLENMAGILSAQGQQKKAVVMLERALEIQASNQAVRQRLIQLLVSTKADPAKIAAERRKLAEQQPAQSPKRKERSAKPGRD